MALLPRPRRPMISTIATPERPLPPAAHAKVDSFASTLKVLESTQIRNVSVRDICTMLILWPRILFFLTSCPFTVRKPNKDAISENDKISSNI